jgi:Hemingway/CFA97
MYSFVSHPIDATTVTSGFGRKSLNREQRKKELLKITVENQNFLKRLQDKSSNYSVAKWEEDFKHKEKIMKNMCEYPFIFDDRNL